MTPEQMQQLAQDIVGQTIRHTWPYWLIFMALLFLATFVGIYVSRYAGKRGEQLATKADFQQLLDQLRQTTATAEAIKSEIAVGEWSKKEQRALRRQKLELVAQTTRDLTWWLERETNRCLFNGLPVETPSPMDTLYLISNVYLPDLNAEIVAVSDAYTKYYENLLTAQPALRDVASTPQYTPTLHRFTQIRNSLYPPFYAAVTALEKKCGELLRSAFASPDA